MSIAYRPVFAAAMITLVGLVPATVSAVRAQGAAPKQVALTQAQVDDLVSAQKDIQKAESGGSPDKPDPAIDTKLAAVAKAHGFSDLAQLSDVSYSVGLVMGGIDPESKDFVGASAVVKKEIAQVQADKSMKPADKKEALSELNATLHQPAAEKPMDANIALVKTNFDKLSQAMQQPE